LPLFDRPIPRHTRPVSDDNVGMLLFGGIIGLEFGRRGEGVSKRPQKEGQSQRQPKPDDDTSQLLFSN
jgi:hypothetical protein